MRFLHERPRSRRICESTLILFLVLAGCSASESPAASDAVPSIDAPIADLTPFVPPPDAGTFPDSADFSALSDGLSLDVPVEPEIVASLPDTSDTGEDAAALDVFSASDVFSPPDSAPDDMVDITTPPPQVVLITEIMAKNATPFPEGSGDTPDWIEIFNPGPESVDLLGWTLTDDLDEPAKWTFPAVSLVPGEYLVVLASGTDVGGPGGLHATLSLDSDGEVIALSRPDGTLSHSLEFGPQREDVSYGLSQNVSSYIVAGDGSAARFAVGAPEGWTAPGFSDGDWTEVALGIGYDGELGGPEAGFENAALLKPTDQSTDGYGFTGVQAVDGVLQTFSHTALGDLTPWWEVDLVENYLIESITLWNRLDCCPERLYNITVEIRNAKGEAVYTSPVLNPIPVGQAPVSPGNKLVVTPPKPVIGKTVHVSKTAVGGAGQSEWLTFAEVEVWGSWASPYADQITTDIETAMKGISAVGYLRIPTLSTPEPPNRLTLAVAYDDAFTAWLDGEKIASANLLGEIPAVPHPADGFESFAIDPALLTWGQHILSFQGFNIAADDDDFLLRPTLIAEKITTNGPGFFKTPTPGGPNGVGVEGFLAPPKVDAERGFYKSPFSLTLTHETPGVTLVYTLDGSVPTLSHGTVIPPQDAVSLTTGVLPVETTTILRAAVFREGWEPSPVITHTYLFLDDVIDQPAKPTGFPEVWDGMGQDPIAADYEMDPEIVYNPTYHDDLLLGLRSIPTMSIVTDNDGLFGAANGIYIHSLERGELWERAVSVELILPDGATGFAVDCGLRIHGYGWRPHNATRKHSLRLEFRKKYGPANLEYPLFADSPADKFDSIVLRSQGHRGFQDPSFPYQACYIRDSFARDTARDMGKIDGHATYVHLYLNGLYWGLYNPVERPDADFGARYFGGEANEYDAINRRVTTNEAIDGTLDAYNEMLAVADQGLSTPEGYAKIQQYLNLDDLIDYMLIHQYTTNQDGPETFQHNNMRGVRRREPGAQFHFFVWDMEYSIWKATDSWNINVDVPGSVSHVYAKLRENPEFRKRFSDRAKIHLTGAGALTPEACAARWETRAQEIELAIVGESARWGDAKHEPPYTRDVEWTQERNRLLTQYFPQRTAILIQQLTAAGLYGL